MSTMAQIAKTIRLHGENCRYFQLYQDVEKYLRNQIITATPKNFTTGAAGSHIGTRASHLLADAHAFA